jgi:hypothetical protein
LYVLRRILTSLEYFIFNMSYYQRFEQDECLYYDVISNFPGKETTAVYV